MLTADTKFEYGLKTLLANGISIKLKAKQVGGNWQIEKISFINQAVMKLSGNVLSNRSDQQHLYYRHNNFCGDRTDRA